jgi:hypothetical protein
MPLPRGLAINSLTGAVVGNIEASAAVNGLPTDYTFTIQGVNTAGQAARRTQEITIYPPPAVTLVTPAGTVGVPYVGSVVGANGSEPYSFAVQSGALPTSVSLDAFTGALTGTPTVAGTFTGTFRVSGLFGAYLATDPPFSIVIS